jgi:twitching motility protein PilT
MMLANGADELRIGTDLPPKMYKRGAPVRLSIPATDDGMMRHLLGELWDDKLQSGQKTAFSYSSEVGTFAATMSARENGVDATFKQEIAKPKAPPLAPPPPAPVAAPIAAPVAARIAAPVAAPIATAVPRGSLLERAVELGASDLHLCQGEPPMIRVDGRLRAIEGHSDSLLGDLASGVDLSKHSADLALALEGVGRFRVNLYRAGDKLAAAIRILPRAVPTLSELHMPVPLADLVHAPHGLVIVCGPTGSGKSATLAALAAEALRHRGGGLLISLEDPIEYQLAGGLIRQRQIGRDVRDFASGLRDALREDPDVLLIGEMRDPESITLALTAAETGHLVLTSLHSRSASASVERIVDSYPPERQQQVRVQLADALRAVIAQRLVPRARGNGRLPAVEILRGIPAVATLIRDGKTAQLPNVIQSSKKEGMLPLDRCLADLLRAGQIDRESALAAANDPASLATMI